MINAMKLKTNAFAKNEDGAVTVDWVVLTASVIGLGVAVLVTIASGATTYATTLNTEVGSIDVVTH